MFNSAESRSVGLGMRSIIVAILLFVIYPSTIECNNEQRKPNILIILADDQDIVLGGMDPMSTVKRMIADNGATFENAFTSTPLCCPSRASLLSGKYSHNHHTVNNSVSGGCYGDHWRSTIEPHTVAPILSAAGYVTFYAGKYLNSYYGSEVPPGWHKFYGLHGNSRYYNYTLRENDKNIKYSDTYLTDLLRDKTVNFLEQHMQQNANQPFFAIIAPPAPHEPFTPAERHRDTFKGIVAPRSGSYNTVDKEKHWLLASSTEIPNATLELMDSYYQKRWETLLSVDELVHSVLIKLQDSGELEHTYIIYTSDNGYHIGQFAQPFDKRQPYETDVRIPLYVRGPSIQKGVSVSAPVLLIDLLPTIMEWSKLPADPLMDGQTLSALLINSNGYDALKDPEYHRGLLLQHSGEGNFNTYNPECEMWRPTDRLFACIPESACHCQDAWNNTYACVRNFGNGINHLYCEFKDNEDFVEFYDLDADPHQMSNTGRQMLPIERALYSLALRNLTTCVGSAKCAINIFT